jgi:hypothetical protein
MAEEHTVTNATLYSLMQKAYNLLDTVHANQLKYDIPQLAALITKLAALDAKLEQILLQVTPPETVNLNLETATITPKE